MTHVERGMPPGNGAMQRRKLTDPCVRCGEALWSRLSRKRLPFQSQPGNHWEGVETDGRRHCSCGQHYELLWGALAVPIALAGVVVAVLALLGAGQSFPPVWALVGGVALLVPLAGWAYRTPCLVPVELAKNDAPGPGPNGSEDA